MGRRQAGVLWGGGAGRRTSGQGEREEARLAGTLSLVLVGLVAEKKVRVRRHVHALVPAAPYEPGEQRAPTHVEAPAERD